MVGEGGVRRIRAAVLWAANTPLEVVDADLSPPRAGEVEVQVVAAGVCGSDVHQLLGEYRLPLPCVPGHEGAGVVSRVGPGVGTLAPGDHVVLLWRSACGQCAWCLDGRPALCEHAVRIRSEGVMPDGTSRFAVGGRSVHHFIGVSCWSAYTVVPAAAAVRIDPEVPLDVAALVGCAVVTGVGAAWNAAALRPWQSAAVFGCGGVGLNVIQGAALAGAYPIVAVDAQPAKEALARQFGASHFVCVGQGGVGQGGAGQGGADAARADAARAVAAGRRDEVAAAVVEITKGGADAAFEVVGLPALQETALAATRRGGTTVLVGVAAAGARMTLDPEQLVQQEKTVRGCIYGSGRPDRDIPRILRAFAEGRLQLGALMSRRYGLSEINRAVAAMRAGNLGRVVLDPAR